ncbi:hypothetical protein FHX37_0998 [Haloactinospora alba]|uniref:Uncharacterized protein n=1 Tax=Haloactinospora alba TaxID=405555 RepID=A0A543NGX9_9ACTN|nr:hypothetical protein [Haloactinospora alba]TQN31108.1 hypothetical protein FHX37_0998 [Haloactinospora alba]
MNQTTAPAALERLRRHLYEAGVQVATDHDGLTLVFLHADCVSISATAQRYRIEHLDDDGETRRAITLAHARIDDAVRLVRAYLSTRHQHARPNRPARLPHAGGRS